MEPSLSGVARIGKILRRLATEQHLACEMATDNVN
jgi:hypothetical protein